MEFKQFIKICFERQDFKSHIYVLGIIPAIAKLCPEDFSLCELFNYLIINEFEVLKSTQDLSFILTPFYVALTSLVPLSIPLLKLEHVEQLCEITNKTYSNCKSSNS